MNSIFFLAVWYSMVYMCHIFVFIQSITDGDLGWFQVFAIANSAAVNIYLGIYLLMGLLGQMAFLFLDP